jgi:uncharacterized protein (DUF2384 family)
MDDLTTWLGLTDAELAALLADDAEEFGSWCKHEIDAMPDTQAERIALTELAERLRTTFRSADDARAWMHNPNLYLGGLLPVDVLRSSGAQWVHNALEVIDSGIYV